MGDPISLRPITKYGYFACVPEHTHVMDVPGHSRMVLSGLVPCSVAR
eukprot:gene11134-biopygen15885